MPLSFIDLLSAGSNNDAGGNPIGIAINAIVDSTEVLGAIKKPLTQSAANGLWESMTATDGSGITSALGEKNTLRCDSSLIFITDSTVPGFHVLKGTQGDESTYEWEPLGDHLGVSLSSLKIQDPGTSTAGAGQVTDFTTGAIAVDSLRLGSLDTGGLTVAQTNEVVVDSDTINDTLRISLKNSANLSSEYDMGNGDDFKVMMWNSTANQLEGSPIAVSSDGTNQTVTISGSLDVTGTLTQGVNVSATSLDVSNQYIKSNDGYENVNNVTSLSQGGFLVQTGVTTDDGLNSGTITKYHQRGFYWDGAEECWYIGAFESTATDASAVYSETNNVASGASGGIGAIHTPVFKLATPAGIHLPSPASGGYSDQEEWGFHYLTPNAAFTKVVFGAASSDYDIDGDAGNTISNQGMILDGTVAGVTSDSGVQLISGTAETLPSTNFATTNVVRTARILRIRAIATTQNAADKSIKIELPGDGVIDFYDDIMLVNVYQVVGTSSSHTRTEIFGAEIIPPDFNSAASVAPILEIRFNQLGFSAGDVFDVCVVV